MLANIQDVEDWLRINDLRSWHVQKELKENRFVFTTSPEDALETRFAKFRECMRSATGGRYYIYAHKEDEMTNKNRFFEEFSSLGTTQVAASAASAVGAVPDGYISRSEFEALWQQKTQELEVIQLKAKIVESEAKIRELETPIYEMGRKLEPLVMPIVSGLAKTYFPQVAGSLPANIEMQDVEAKNNREIMQNEQNTEFELPDHDAERLTVALNKWRNADPDFILLIEKIADMAGSGKTYGTFPLAFDYPKAKSMLLNL